MELGIAAALVRFLDAKIVKILDATSHYKHKIFKTLNFKLSQDETSCSAAPKVVMAPLVPIGWREGDSHGRDEGPRLRHQHAPQQGRERRRNHQREMLPL